MNQEKIHVIDHPMVQHKLCLLRDKDTGVKENVGALPQTGNPDFPTSKQRIFPFIAKR